jgi:hypothetical protein
MFIPEFSEDQIRRTDPSYMFGDDPFVVSVQCQKTEMGYLADFWVSGRKWEDDSPTLILRLRLGVTSNKSELREDLLHLWDVALRELSFGSAMVGGIRGTTGEVNELSEPKKRELLRFHLWGNERLGNFNILGDTKTEKTANMYLMLKSFGTKQPQKAITQLESELLKREIDPTVISQRLMFAKKQGYLK